MTTCTRMSVLLIIAVSLRPTEANWPGEGPGTWDDYNHNKAGLTGWPRPGWRVSADGKRIEADTDCRSKLTEYEMKMADFAQESYHAPGERRPIHNTRVLEVTELMTTTAVCWIPRQPQCPHSSDVNDLLDPQVAVMFVDDANKEIVLALRGTYGFEDVGPDKDVAEGKFSKSDRARQSLNTLRALKRYQTSKLPDHTIILAGHSLGGTEALLLLAQDVERNVIQHEGDDIPTAVAAVFTFNAYCDRYTTPEAYMGDAMKHQSAHGAYVNGDVLSFSAMKVSDQVAHHSERLVILQRNYSDLAKLTWHKCANFTSPDYHY